MMKRILFFMLLLPLSLVAQKITPEEYIETYKDIAMQEMKKHKIPASITLAQGLLESGAGNSDLARKAKNHFGIKCHKEWHGRTFRMDDDAKNECFRRYRKAEDSFRDHSEFLMSRSRYADLFKLNIMDYKSWAHGLKAAGYATNPSYASLLITRIETYKLYLYDQQAMGKISERELKKLMKESGVALPVDDGPWHAYSPASVSSFELVDMTKNERFIYENNHVKFVFAKEGETPKSLAKEMRICKKRLCSFNLIKDPKEVVFHNGDVVYLQPLRNKNRKAKSYVVEGGETIRDVALRFAVKPDRILKLNKLPEGARLQRGQKLKLR